MGSVGAFFGGLLLGFKDLLPYLVAQRSGVIVRRGRETKVRRDQEPEVFERLLANRSKGAATGFGLSMAGAVVLSLFWLAAGGISGPAVVLVFIFYGGFTLFALYCLLRGFTTGKMFAFWGLTLFGEAGRKENPTWFWGYGAMNVLIVLIGLSSMLGAISG